MVAMMRAQIVSEMTQEPTMRVDFALERGHTWLSILMLRFAVCVSVALLMQELSLKPCRL